MTLTKQAKKKKSLKKQHQEGEEEEEQPLKNRPPLPIVCGAAVPEEAAILRQGIRPPVKMSKEAGRQQQAARRQEPAKKHSQKQQSSKSDEGKSSGKNNDAELQGSASSEKLSRKPSLRRKFGALLRGSADLPAAINRGLQPIRRSMSFGKDLERERPQRPDEAAAAGGGGGNKQQPHQHQHHVTANAISGLKPFRTRSVQWYNSLSSLAEHEAEEGKSSLGGLAASEEQLYYNEPRSVVRTQSLMEKSPEVVTRRKKSNVEHAAPYGRYSDHYDISIDLSKPPCAASSLPVLTRDTIDGEDAESGKSHGWMEQQVKNGWGNLRASARNLSVLRGLGFSSGKRSASQSVSQ